MLNNKFKAILFIFLVLFCIAAANAESIDNNTGIDSVNIESIDSANDVVVIEEAVSSETGNFSALNKTINGNSNNGNEIKLDKNYTYNKSTDSNFKNGIKITKSVVIDGQGHTIDGNHTAKIFNVTSANLTLKNVKLVNANATIDKVYGGAIQANISNLTVINCTFSNNYAKYSGGAIGATGSVVTVINSTFTNNSATNTGGAIRSDKAKNQPDGVLFVYNSTFTNNSGYHAGAIGSHNNITVVNSIFTNNTSRGNGTAISSVNVTVINSTFISNHADNKSKTEGFGGAIIVNSKGIGTVTGSTFINNTANGNGGAICSKGYSLYVDNCTFLDNLANNSGGAIYNSGKLMFLILFLLAIMQLVLIST